MPTRVLFPASARVGEGWPGVNCGPLATGGIVRTGHQRLTSSGTVADCRRSVLSCLLRETGDPGALGTGQRAARLTAVVAEPRVTPVGVGANCAASADAAFSHPAGAVTRCGRRRLGSLE